MLFNTAYYYVMTQRRSGVASFFWGGGRQGRVIKMMSRNRNYVLKKQITIIY